MPARVERPERASPAVERLRACGTERALGLARLPKEVPEDHRGDAPIGTPDLRASLGLGRRRGLRHTVQHADRFTEPEVATGEDVGPAQVKQLEHSYRPDANAGQGHQAVLNLVVGELLDIIQRAVYRRFGEGAHVPNLRLGEPSGPEVVRRQGEHALW